MTVDQIHAIGRQARTRRNIYAQKKFPDKFGTPPTTKGMSRKLLDMLQFADYLEDSIHGIRRK